MRERVYAAAAVQLAGLAGQTVAARETGRAGRTMAFPRLFSGLVALLALASAVPADPAVAAEDAAPAEPFVRGDVDASLTVNVTDAVKILQYLFTGDPAAWSAYRSCPDAWDVDDSGSVSLTDAIALLGYLFHAAPAPPPPFPSCGHDPTEDDLECERFLPCRPADRRIELYGETFELDAAIFVIQKLESAVPKMESTRTEVRRAVRSMPDGMRWAAVVFDSRVLPFPPRTEENRILAVISHSTRHEFVEFFASIQAGAGTCINEALKAAYEFVTAGAGLRTAILLVGSGENYCQGADSETYGKMALRLVRTWSPLKVPIHTFDVASPDERSAGFLRDLAAETGGTYTWVER